MVPKTGIFKSGYVIRPGVKYAPKVNYSNVKFGQITLFSGSYTQGAQHVDSSVNPSDIERKYGTNVYNYLNSALPTIQTAIDIIGNQELQSNAGVNANTTKTSEEILNSVTNSATYGELSAAKTELEVGKNNLTKSYNDEVSSYVNQNVQAVLSELGIEIPTLDTISGEFENYDSDMEKLTEGQNSCQASQDECNTKMPEISQMKCEAKSRVDALDASVSNLEAQIEAAKKNNLDVSKLESKLAEVKDKLKEANADLAKYESQENALKEAISQLDKKKVSIEEDKKDLTNYHEAESRVVDKTYQIAQNDDKKLDEYIKKLKNKQREIKKVAKDTDSTITSASDNTRNERLERLQKEYEKIALDASDVFVDLDLLISDNDGNKTLANSLGQMYSIENYDEAKNILVDGKID